MLDAVEKDFKMEKYATLPGYANGLGMVARGLLRAVGPRGLSARLIGKGCGGASAPPFCSRASARPQKNPDAL